MTKDELIQEWKRRIGYAQERSDLMRRLPGAPGCHDLHDCEIAIEIYTKVIKELEHLNSETNSEINPPTMTDEQIIEVWRRKKGADGVRSQTSSKNIGRNL